MSVTKLIHVVADRLLDGLWALGGIGAAAELGLEPHEGDGEGACPCPARSCGAEGDARA